MSDANFASLSSTLLARKGGAKPAMRPQSGIIGPFDGKEAAASLEDLGWNDMGDEYESDQHAATDRRPPQPAVPDNLIALSPASATPVAQPTRAEPDEAEPSTSPVRESLSRIQAQFDDAPADRPVVARKPKATKTKASAKRAAFTLRLDQDRHLMLRLACTVRNRSAQQLVTDALDALLAEMPEVASLAAQVQRSAK